MTNRHWCPFVRSGFGQPNQWLSGGELVLEKTPASPKLEGFVRSTQFHGGNGHGMPF